MSIRVCQNSFSRGIISPSLDARYDLEQYNLSLKELQNGIVLQEGCVQNRAGLEFLEKVKYQDKKCRIIPFVFSLEQSYILELGEYYIRFLKDGAYILDNDSNIYEIETPFKEKDLFNLDYVQQADTITFVHKDYKPLELSRNQHNNWQLNEILFGAKINPPTNITINYTGSTSSNTTTYNYVVTSVHKSTNEESIRSSIVSVTGHLEAYWTASEYITLNWKAVENAQEYNIYRSVNGIFGYVGTSNTTTFKDDNIEPDLSNCAPIYDNPFEEQNPSAVCYFQQRKIYAASSTSPQTLWASKTNTNNNFSISRPLNAVDSINMTLYDNVANTIQHLIPLNDLVVITTNAEWAVNGSDGVFCASPAPVANIQSYYGASRIKPVISGSMVLYVQSGGNILRDMGYDYLSDSYSGEELTILANHLFENKTIVDLAYSKEPGRIVWAIMSDGTLNGLTYNPAQKISAWHTHKTKGEFESVAVIREGNEDIAYFVIKRKINNETVRYIERFKSRTIKTLDDGFFLDCAMKHTFEDKVSKIYGLNHLKGEKVCAVLDRGVVEELEVSEDGSIELPYKAKNVLIGFPYTFKLQTLNLESEGTLGISKIINKVEVKILNSREDFFIQNDNHTIQQNARSHESINFPEKLFSKTVQFTLLDNCAVEKNITILQKFPLPLSICAIISTISVEEVETQ